MLSRARCRSRTTKTGKPPADRRCALAILLLCLLLTACSPPPPLPPPPPAELTAGPKTETIYVVETDWHTEIGLQAARLDERLAQLNASFPGFHALVIGFGARPWVLHQQHDIGDLLAASAPGAGAMLVSPLRDRPDAASPASDVIVLHVSARGLALMIDFIVDSFERRSDGALRPIASMGPSEIIYGSTRVYSAGYTCNTWTAQALQTAGLPVRVASVVFAGEVADQARRIAAASPGNSDLSSTGTVGPS
jgi:hypothetical protein